MGTIMMVFEGDLEGDVRTMVCDYVDPTGKPSKMKGVTTIVSENEHKYESWGQTPTGETFQNMEIIYTRPMEEKREHVREEKLGSPAKTAMGLIEARGPCAGGGFTGILPARGGAGRVRIGEAAKLAADDIRLPQDAFAIAGPLPDQGLRDLYETWLAVFLIGRDIADGEKGNQIGGQKEIGGRSALSHHRQHDLHEVAVEVGTLIPVDQDVDKMLVQYPDHPLISPRGPRQHVAPVAGRVTDGEIDRLVFPPRPLKRRLSPRIPVDGIVGVSG